VKTQLLSRRNRVFRHLIGLALAGAGLLAHMSPAHANQPVDPFGIPCDTVGPAGLPYAPGVNCRVMAVDGLSRRYVVWVPLAGVPANSPAVFMLHGASGTGEEVLNRSGWREKATQEGFAAIFPTAAEHFVLENQRFSTRWNNYDLPLEIDPNRRPQGYPATSPWPADDVKFIRQIGDDVIQQLATDPRRMYVAGFSSGGGMCARLGVELSHLIAAVACHSSGLHQVHETLLGHRNLSAYFSLGTRDDNALGVVNSYLTALGRPTIPELPLNPAQLEQIPQIKMQILLNLDSFNLAATPVSTQSAATWTEFRAQTPQAGNADGNELYFTFLDELTHHYPSGTSNPQNPLGFNLPDRVWPFFVQHPRP
jgi:poly(3-hydroxybutyrate) depolymerase